MVLNSLVLCADEKILRVVRRALADLEIGVDHCTDADSALRKLTRDRFEAIIVDCADPLAAEVLRSARNAPCNKRAIAVAIVDGGVGLRSAFDLGAHFVLYKPLSSERAKSSFRAARALMKRERRRNSRCPLQIPVAMANGESGSSLKVITTDLSEGGMAVKIPRNSRPSGQWRLSFTLPGTPSAMEVAGEFAWEGDSTQAGVRFLDLAPDATQRLQDWLSRNSPDSEKDDPPVSCKLTDLSAGGCYLQIASPFPISTRVTLSAQVAGAELRAEGVVRVMHPETGMGVEFTQTTSEHRQGLEKLQNVLTVNRDLLPELLVQPEGLELPTSSASDAAKVAAAADTADPLLKLFRTDVALSAEAFQEKLRKRRTRVSRDRGVPANASA